ncbi:flagellar basal body-associated FliL family protein [Oceanibium sediminis]|uniref:flagellar basal body-associated FliL family protein n=1 Tax=Oceanibium sediminis TaxID=2026339 RepID=UPI000DD34032|nr:flagellar basal body-associated FliL family protein [Oceanibium sediminis]
MADTTNDNGHPARKGSGLKALTAALLGAILAGAAGFGVTYTGVLDGIGGPEKVTVDRSYSFVPLDPLMISLGPDANARTLKFTAQLEVEPGAEAAVTAHVPRILDVLNTYLRAVDEAELADPGALPLLRAQMLRRIQIVVGDAPVRDLLILEFVMN